MYRIKIEDQFKKDVNHWKRKIPELKNEVDAVLDVIMETGNIPKEYDPHVLTNPYLLKRSSKKAPHFNEGLNCIN